jgi:hypothetical protein
VPNGKKRKSQRSFYYEDEDYSSVVETFKFPFMNEYLREHSGEYLKTLELMDGAK